MDEDDDYYGSIVLGISDALIEMTGVLAGLTFALKDLKLVALSGLVTGIAASLSMGASEFLSKRAESRNSLPIKEAFYTSMSYLFVVTILISPYLLIEQERFGLEPHIFALSLTLCMGVFVVAGFNKWISVKQNQPFFSRFLEMLGILAIVTGVSYAIGIGLASAINV
jgi:VIT1/CCC1 family predicted Fe2+/Mn2+ transporter|tara:strand:+ start:1089 stop:1592 length:504 start_codon:yes stop_codon:yes gene_type:complete